MVEKKRGLWFLEEGEREKQSWKSQGFFFLQLLLIVEKQSGMYFSHSPPTFSLKYELSATFCTWFCESFWTSPSVTTKTIDLELWVLSPGFKTKFFCQDKYLLHFCKQRRVKYPHCKPTKKIRFPKSITDIFLQIVNLGCSSCDQKTFPILFCFVWFGGLIFWQEKGKMVYEVCETDCLLIEV